MEKKLSKINNIIYLNYLDYERNLVSEQGFISLKNRTKQIIIWFQNEKIPLKKVTLKDALRCKEWISKTKKKNGELISIGTMINRLKAARKFFNYLFEIEYIKSNPFKEISYPRMPSQIIRNVLTESQMELLLNKLSSFNECKTKDEFLKRYCCHIYSEFLYATGLRVSEAAHVKISDIDFFQRTVFVKNGKGGRSRIAHLTGYASDVLKIYLEKNRNIILDKNKTKHSEYLFGISDSTLQHKLNSELKKICKNLNIPIITSHGFRHSLGTHLLRAGCDMRYIQTILGHESIESTQRYTKVYKEDLRKSLDLYHPRSVLIN